ncbi:phage integrase SAM-like domain-containing protein [Spirosoma areae]
MFIKMRVRFWFRKQQGQSSGQLGILYGTITIHKTRSEPFSTGISVKKGNWNAKTQQVTGRQGAILNDELTAIHTDLLTIKQNLQNAKQDVTAESVRAEWLRQQHGPDSLLMLMKLHEKHQRKYGKGKKGKPLTDGTFRQYETNQAYLADYLTNHKAVSLNPEKINAAWLLRFEQYLMTRPTHPLKQSSVNYAITYINQVLKFALANELIRTAPALFHKLTPAIPTEPTPLTDSEFRSLEQAELPQAQRRAVDCFLFLRYTGLHYVDGRNITNSSIQVDTSGREYLRVVRQKTEEPALIPYHPKAKAVAKKYGGLACLPFTEFDNMNNQLKAAAKSVGIGRNITPGTARDTFADDCSNNMNMSDESLAAMLGHTTTGQVKKYRKISIERIAKEWKE